MEKKTKRQRTAATPPDDALLLEFDGKGASRDAIDTQAILDFASAYLELLAKTASEELERETELVFTGLWVQAKCLRLAARSSDAFTTGQCVVRAAPWIENPATAPQSVAALARRSSLALSRLPPKQTGLAIVKDVRQPLIRMVHEPSSIHAQKSSSLTTLRAKPIRVGGQTPRAMFKSLMPDGVTLSLTLSEEQARGIGQHLYMELEISVRLDQDGDKYGGELIGFLAVADVNPSEALKAWREYHKQVGISWDSLEDPESERHRD